MYPKNKKCVSCQCGYTLSPGLPRVLPPPHAIAVVTWLPSLLGISPWWKRHITQLQIAQFVCSGIFFLVLMYCVHGRGQSCKGLRWAYLSTAFNMTLLVQFVGVLRTPPRKMEKGG